MWELGWQFKKVIRMYKLSNKYTLFDLQARNQGEGVASIPKSCFQIWLIKSMPGYQLNHFEH